MEDAEGGDSSSPEELSTRAAGAPPVEEQSQPLTVDQRKQIFASTMQTQVSTGGRIESQEAFQAVVVRRPHPNRRRHLTITLLTGGFWLVMWLARELTLRPYKKRQLISVDELGRVTIQPADAETAAQIVNALGAPQVAGTLVSPKGLTRSVAVSHAGGEVGGAVAFAWIGSFFVWIGHTIGSVFTDAGLETFPRRRRRKVHEGGRVGPIYEGAPKLPHGQTAAYVAVTADEVAIIHVHTHLVKKLTIGPSVAGRVARSAVASAELDRGLLLAKLRIGFEDAGWWEFEVPAIYQDTAQQVVHALGGRVH